jgi:hypothetical protein
MSVAQLVGAFLAAGGGGAVIAWAIFAKLGDRWFENRFAQRLETFKHEQTKEIEQLRHRIAALFSRISKIHEKEFKILPTAWLKLHEAYGRVFRVASTMKTFPLLNAMSQPQFEEFVATCRLPKFRKQELRDAKDRDDYYRQWIFWTDFAEAQTAHTEFRNYFVMNRIFMTKDLHEKFGEIDRLLSSVLIAAELDRQTPGTGLRKDLGDDLAKIAPLLPTLEAAIQARLQYTEA